MKPLIIVIALAAGCATTTEPREHARDVRDAGHALALGAAVAAAGAGASAGAVAAWQFRALPAGTRQAADAASMAAALAAVGLGSSAALLVAIAAPTIDEGEAGL
jgi:hypothetical protein